MDWIGYIDWIIERNDIEKFNETIKSYCLFNDSNITEIFEFCNGYCERTDKDKKSIIRLKHKNRFRKNGKRILEVINKNTYVCSLGNDEFVLLDKDVLETYHKDFKI